MVKYPIYIASTSEAIEAYSGVKAAYFVSTIIELGPFCIGDFFTISLIFVRGRSSKFDLRWESTA
jgi:hypothetical protein